uniref:Integrase, catalytic region, zinc finger, CCHC-type, peptidase aspartic, catalytic n=1 Tax=Tanacetum cinerariifolium TaxID=118510 RepID=A0A6L2JB64_TANCI|nr:hypothetical protein [Tanacetum cinerariifolium]
MTTLAEFMIVTGADNRPPMLDKPKYESWKSRMELYIQDNHHGWIKLNSIENGPLVWPTVKQDDGTATNIVLQGLPPDIYALVNHHKVAKETWDRVKLLMQGTSWSRQECECKLYDDFDKFSHVKGLAVPTFLPGDDPISCMKKAMEFMSAVFSSYYPSTNNQLRSSSNLRNQTTIQDGKGDMARQYSQLKRKRDVTWFKEKVLLVQAHAEAFQTDDLDVNDSDCDDISFAKAVLMANLSSCDSDVLSKVPYSDTSHNDMMNQSVQGF